MGRSEHTLTLRGSYGIEIDLNWKDSSTMRFIAERYEERGLVDFTLQGRYDISCRVGKIATPDLREEQGTHDHATEDLEQKQNLQSVSLD